MADADFGHVPVLADRCIELLTPALTRHQPRTGPARCIVDATIGAGGHAERLLSELPGLRLIGLDRDPSAWRSPAPGCRDSATGSRWCAPATTAWPPR